MVMFGKRVVSAVVLKSVRCLKQSLCRRAEENSLAVFTKEVLKGWRNSKRYLLFLLSLRIEWNSKYNCFSQLQQVNPCQSARKEVVFESVAFYIYLK